MSTFNEIAAAARDAFVLLQGAKKIEYRDGDSWELEAGQVEHPATARLRTVAMASMTNQPEDINESTSELQDQIRAERHANNNMREFLVQLEEACHANGMPKTIVGEEVLTWLKGRLSATA
jgi:hypothetical protein